jgi:predicted nucleic acid-binding Zn ribbon protein
MKSKASQAGAALAAMRPLINYECPVCATKFRARSTRAKFCSNACRQFNKYQKATARAYWE